MNRKKAGKRKILLGAAVLLGVIVLAVFLGCQHYFKMRGHGNITCQVGSFEESDRKLNNPNCGFYYIHGFWITDEVADYKENVSNRFAEDKDTTLAMIQINLQNYRDREISEQGLLNIEALFTELEQIDKNLILRFLYDWDGENAEKEPEDLKIILKHMEQVAPIVNRHKAQIYTMQGLFIGNWGEMNGTKYTSVSDLKTLTNKLVEVLDEDIYLAVRMPMFWRQITDIADLTQDLARSDIGLRLGLYNDGIMGNEQDYGTYGTKSRQEQGDLSYWNREEELAFQKILCEKVPNGGEVIVDNSYNDLENAISSLKTMHISYLNRDYDRNVLNKWAAETISQEGCFDGMDGLSYVERHLGYRFLVDHVAVDYSFKEDEISVTADIKNVGFSPIYKAAKAELVVYHHNTGTWESYSMEGDLRALSGGNDSQQIETFSQKINLTGEEPGQIDLYVKISDVQTGQQILLANEQEAVDLGYKIGTLEVETVEQLWKR